MALALGGWGTLQDVKSHAHPGLGPVMGGLRARSHAIELGR
jgi:hypothetical protein